MLLSAVSVLVVAQSSSEIPEGLMNNPVLTMHGHTNFRCGEFIQVFLDKRNSFVEVVFSVLFLRLKIFLDTGFTWQEVNVQQQPDSPPHVDCTAEREEQIRIDNANSPETHQFSAQVLENRLQAESKQHNDVAQNLETRKMIVGKSGRSFHFLYPHPLPNCNGRW